MTILYVTQLAYEIKRDKIIICTVRYVEATEAGNKT